MSIPDDQTLERVARELFEEVGQEMLEKLEATQRVGWSLGSRIVASFTVVARTPAKAKRVGLSREPWGGSVVIMVYMEGGAYNEDTVEQAMVRPRLNELLFGEHFNG